MRGTKAKAQRRIRNADFAQLEHAVNHNYMMAAAMREGLSQALMLNFWANVAMAAVLQFIDNRRSQTLMPRDNRPGHISIVEPGHMSIVEIQDLEKATFFEPSGVEI